MIDVVVPKYLENMALPSPELVTYYENLENRCLWIDEEITTDSLEYAKLILGWNREDKNKPVEERKPIRLIFFSPGGSLYVNNTLIDIIEISKTPVYGYNAGQAFSAACFIFLSCHKRYCLKNASFLLHKGSAYFEGTSGEVDAWKNEYDRRLNNLVSYTCSKTNADEDEVREKIVNDWYISAEEAHEWGMVDQIIENIDTMWE